MSHWDEQDRVLALVVDTVVGTNGSTGGEGGPIFGPPTGRIDEINASFDTATQASTAVSSSIINSNNIKKNTTTNTRTNRINNLTINPLCHSDNLLETVIDSSSTGVIRRFDCATGFGEYYNIYTRVVIPPGNIIHNNNKNKRKFIDILEGSNKKIKNINDKLIKIFKAMTPTWSMRLLSVSCGSVVCAWGLLLVLSVLGGGASHGTGEHEYGGFDNVGNMEDLNGAKCPWACSCTGQDVDCSERGLTQVPGDLAVLAEKL